ncbi:dihydrofolate reductase [Acuticoccus mangrovi]|uniref:Dihydrofolate reductase n=1 Tax=Acuticoccus mangrovi TaxID=2796142 RepID=A0A934INA8_9HYPH|nr:dihydrofolate reductase [Acuticoccus mangrovi]MBJ3775523.1 dihydrofolate reductase [Acuticoccus mangrovi]
MPIALIVAAAENGVIGQGGALPWRLPSDLAHFKRLTLGNTIVVGRRTHESIGKALPGRRTIVVSRGAVADMEVAPSLAAAVARAETPVFLAGGAGIYDEGMGIADTIHLTRVHAAPEGDVTFPPIDPTVFALQSREPGTQGPRDDHPFSFETYVRIGTAVD